MAADITSVQIVWPLFPLGEEFRQIRRRGHASRYQQAFSS
jgi:hypothetical protein